MTSLQSLDDIQDIYIIGLGQMGYSLAIDIRENMPDVNLIGIVPNKQEAKSIESRDDYKTIFGENSLILTNAWSMMASEYKRLIIIATPIKYIDSYFFLFHNLPNTIITDISSSKSSVINLWDNLNKDKTAQFIGSHPMCGNEKTGHQNAQEGLYKNKTIFLCKANDTTNETTSIIHAFWEKLNANPIITYASIHDKILADTSHSLHIISSAIVNNIFDGKFDGKKDICMPAACAGGFKSMTRIASSSPSMWDDITTSNRKAISQSLENIIESLQEVKGKINNEESILGFFATAKEKRDTFYPEE